VTSAPASPLVSVVIPCFNYARFLGEAIESALGQTHQPIEVIVVNDGSSDDTELVAGRYPVTLINQPNSGVCVAANAGFAAARGEFVLRLDADDRLAKTYVEETLAALKAHPGTHFVYTEVEYFGAESGSYPIEAYNPETLTERNYVHASALMRRASFQEVGGYDLGMRTSRYEDWDLWLRLAERGLHGFALRRPLLQYRKHPTASRGTPNFASVRGVAREIRLASQLQDNHPTLFAPHALMRRISRLPGRVLRREISTHFTGLFLGISLVMLGRSALGLSRRPTSSLAKPLPGTGPSPG
jgi:glycosyltransferase involved in cell wall biosynthesis